MLIPSGEVLSPDFSVMLVLMLIIISPLGLICGTTSRTIPMVMVEGIYSTEAAEVVVAAVVSGIKKISSVPTLITAL